MNKKIYISLLAGVWMMGVAGASAEITGFSITPDANQATTNQINTDAGVTKTASADLATSQTTSNDISSQKVNVDKASGVTKTAAADSLALAPQDGKTVVYVTTPMPGMNCEDVTFRENPYEGVTDTSTEDRELIRQANNWKEEQGKTPLYKCSISSWSKGFLDVMKGFLKYGIFIGLLLGILMLVVSGIRISLSKITGDDSTAKAKQAFLQVLGGLVVLILFGVILNTIAPWIFR